MTMQKKQKAEKDRLQAFSHQLRVEWRSKVTPCASVTGHSVVVLGVFGPDEGGETKGMSERLWREQDAT
jgi:hypothetical protein